MARFLFVTWSGGGNQPPEIGVAQALRERGHEVTFAGYENQRSRFTKLGFEFQVLVGAQRFYSEEAPDRLAMVLDAVWACRAHLSDLPDLFTSGIYDVAVVDCMMFGALAAVEAAGRTAAILVHSAPGLLVPPGGQLEGLLLRPINEVRAAAGLGAINRLWDAYAGFPTICATIPELDPMSGQVPPSFAYVGPIFERVPPSGWRAPWPANDSRPLALVSFSTGRAWDQSSRIQRTLEALQESNVRVLVTAGMADVVGLALPENAVMVPHVPHDEILPQAAVTVTHAGHGTVAASLSYGVPLVCLPNRAGDQPGLAAQVAALGAGLALDGDAATPSEIRSAVQSVLAERQYAARAQQLARVVASAGGSSTAAVALEQVAAKVRPSF